MKTTFTGKNMTLEAVEVELAFAGHINQEYAEALLRQAARECPEAVDVIIRQMNKDGLKVPEKIEDLGPEPEENPNLWTAVRNMFFTR